MMRSVLLLLCLLSVGCPGLCGDGVRDFEEPCDDGNTVDADGCEADCSIPLCLNGIVDPGEICFLSPVEFETDDAPSELITADLNGDGALDIATANSVGESISVLLGNGTGGFSRLPDIDLIGAGIPLVVGDFDGDGVLDLATALATGAEVAQVFRGFGDGAFEPFATLPTSDPRTLATGDLNGDGLLDLVVAGAGVDVFLNSGGTDFLAPLSFPTPTSVSSLVVGNFDGDNALDLVVTLPADDSLLVFLGEGDGDFSPQLPLGAGEGPEVLTKADLDRDGVLDLALTHPFPGEVTVHIGNGAASFFQVKTVQVRGPFFLTTGDLDGNGFLDLAVASGLDRVEEAHLAIIKGEQFNSFLEAPLFLSTGFSSPRAVTLADFDGDGALDAAVTDQGNARLFVFLTQP